jgi:uncharacterized protein YuzE
MTDMARGMETDPESGASYFTLSDEPVVQTASITDLIMVDLDEHGRPVGVEFAGSELPNAVGWQRLFDRFPELRATELSDFAAAAPMPRDTNQRAWSIARSVIDRSEDDHDQRQYTISFVLGPPLRPLRAPVASPTAKPADRVPYPVG